MKQLYFAIEKLVLDTKEVKCADLEQGQLKTLDADGRPVIPFPCALIDISYINCEDISGSDQLVKARVTVKLAFQVQGPTASLSDEYRRKATLSYLDTVDKVNAAIQGHVSENFGKFTRISQTPDNRYPGVKAMTLVYETDFVEITN